MAFVSYAQNFEDVMLWRALNEVAQGFYIDVGANDPDIDSVTKAFYIRGWRGINVEPLQSHWKDLMRERPEDINLRCAAGMSRGEMDIWESDVRGWASLSSEVIEKHESKGRAGTVYKVPVLSLTEICNDHAPSDIHFLKVDVEGFEKSVLEGLDFRKYRPWIVVVEATEPNSTVENYMQWEPALISCGYVFSYADGLNRFYVAQERSELREKLHYPPNVFDRFVRYSQVEAERRATAAERELLAAEQRTLDAKARSDALNAELKMVYSSISWRLTKPLRTVGRIVKKRFARS